MLTQNSTVLVQSGKALLRRGRIALVGGLALATLMFAGTQADARPVEFRFTGGAWSHGYHAGWHRYWGGPTIGFYFAPEPVYVVAGYEAPSYYVGPDYWYSNPSFGLSINIGGGGYVGGGYRGGYYRGVERRDGDDHYRSNYPHDSGYFHGGGDRYSGGGARFSSGFHGHEGSVGRGSFREGRGR